MAKRIFEGEQMVPGKKYKGYAFLNEAKEFCFTPEETGSREGVIKHLATNGGVSVSYSHKFVFAKIKLKRSKQKSEMIATVTREFNNLMKIMMDYDF